MLLRCGSNVLDLTRPIVMGVLNVTPDSFSDGGRYDTIERAVSHARRMEEEGAGLIDIGGESTRPGAHEVSADEEIRRVTPVIDALSRSISIPISIDTSKPEVMIAAVRSGAQMINDVRALMTPGALEAAASTGAAICLMHMQGDPRTMQSEPYYTDVVGEVREFLALRVNACEIAGISRDRLALDPGIGFGKRLEHNLALLASLPSLTGSGLPFMIGASRKSMLGALTGRALDERLSGGLSIAAAAVLAGASILRAHDVRQTVDAVKIATALRDAGYRTQQIEGDQAWRVSTSAPTA